MTQPTTITSPTHPDVEEVQQWMENMIKSLRLVELVAAIVALITRMRDLNTELTRRLTDLRRKRPRSEVLARVEWQLAFAFVALEGIHQPAADESVPAQRQKKTRKGRHPGRATLPKHLERVQEINPVPPHLRICPSCGTEMTTVGHSCCEILDVRPAQLYVRQRLDETVACPVDDTIVSAPTPPQLIERGKLGMTLVVESLADKFIEHQPIERQCLRWARTGVDIAPQTLGRSVAVTIDLLEPVAALIASLTRSPGLLATDASGLPVLDRDTADGIRNGTMWCWINGSWVTFVYSPKGDSASVRRFLGEILNRSVQCDGTSVTTFLERAGGQRPGCWAHARRGLVEAARAGDRIALVGLRMIARLFAVEHQSVTTGDCAVERLIRRLRHSLPLVEQLRTWITETRGTAPPKTPLGAALGYLHRQWKRLLLFLTDGNIELTNNGVERQLRKLVLGRRNWLFTWEDLGGERTAIALTIVGTCVAQGINPRAYLHLVTKLIVGGWPQAKLRDLLPDRLALAYPELRVRTETIEKDLLRATRLLPAPA
jgi:transposase